MAVALFIDIDYFKGELIIGQSESTDTIKSINILIAKYQERFLRIILGDSLYDDFMAGLDVTSPAVPLQKWTDLKNKIVDSTNKISPLTNYVYFFYLQKELTQTVGVGEVKPEVLNGAIVSSTDKQVFAWNEMVRPVRSIVKWLADNSTVYQIDDLDYCEREELTSFKNTFNL